MNKYGMPKSDARYAAARQAAWRAAHPEAAAAIRARYRAAHPLYATWRGMLARCTNPKNISWPWYGARGIKVCERWGTYENFVADLGERPVGMTMDRLDNDGNYEPSNVRWATRKQQRACRHEK